MMRIAVCDDNSNHLQTIKDRILKLGKELETDFIIDSYADGSDLIAKTEILLDNYYSIIVFDIEMKEMGGIQAADILREKGWKTTRFIFISSHTTYFKTLCDLEISAFVEKIELNECFNEKFLRVYNRLGSNEKVYFTYSENKLMKNIKLQDINYFEGKDRKVILHCTEEKEIKINGSIAQIDAELKETSFILIQRSFLINYRFIKAINKSIVHLKDGSDIVIGRKYRENAYRKYISNVERRRIV